MSCTQFPSIITGGDDEYPDTRLRMGHMWFGAMRILVPENITVAADRGPACLQQSWHQIALSTQSLT